MARPRLSAALLRGERRRAGHTLVCLTPPRSIFQPKARLIGAIGRNRKLGLAAEEKLAISPAKP